MSSAGLFVSFIAGVLSFISPCILPLIPAYISYISGISIKELTSEDKTLAFKKRIIVSSLLFIAGFSIIFIGMGATVTTFGKLISSHIIILRRIAGIIIVIFGLHIAGWLKLNFLYSEKKFHIKISPGSFGSFIMGLAFAFGWTPCVGPILASILTYAATQQTLMKGVQLLSAYSLGLGVPFFLTGIATGSFLKLFKRIKKYFHLIEIISGVFLIIIGILTFRGSLSFIFQR
ncbi:sulfite exporter TauE/SafE family protein [Candidatus Aerophobetes bacterium]|nr:sulfite exporter TauE/SafE family protein [Candidatus Aerophobetes bacterium]